MHRNKTYRILIGTVFLVVLMLIRYFENDLFYDPLLNYFKSDFQTQPLPLLNDFKLGIHLFFRFALNTICSLIIIYCFYENLLWVKFSAQLYGFMFLILLIAFFLALKIYGDTNKMLVFFIRRLLIQPLLLLLFLVGFYYQSKVKNRID
jgi:exosortase F-associated protein